MSVKKPPSRKENDMAKEVAKVAEENKVVALPTTTAYEQFAGGGFSEVTTEDLAIPFLRVLAQLSPEVNKRDAKYVQGAEAGMIYNTVLGKVWDGEKGVIIVPCHYSKRFLEWRPRNSGGGFVASYTPEEAAQLRTARNDRNEDILPNGNLLTPTAQFFVLLLHEEGVQPCLLSMTSTQLKKARKWLTQMQAMTAKGKAGTYTLPMFSHAYRLKTVAESNDKGDWFGYDVAKERALDPGNTDDADLIQQAINFMQSVKAGDVKIKHEDSVDHAPSTGASDDNVPF
jgi:hypothetical protein